MLGVLVFLARFFVILRVLGVIEVNGSHSPSLKSIFTQIFHFSGKKNFELIGQKIDFPIFLFFDQLKITEHFLDMGVLVHCAPKQRSVGC